MLNLPDFSTISIDQLTSQLDALLNSSKQQLEDLKAIENPTWENFSQPMQAIDMAIEDFWSPVSHLNGVKNSDALRDVYQVCIEKLTVWGSEQGQDKALFEQYKKLELSPEFEQFSDAQKMWVSKALRSFTLSGVDLDEDKQARFKAIQKRLAELSQKFSNNVLDATAHFEHLLASDSALAGVPDSMQAMFKAKAEEKGKEGFLIGLDFPSYHSIVTYADNAILRKKLYLAYQTKASDMAKLANDEALQFNNSDIMLETLQLRQEMAKLLDFEHYAQRSLFTKMADNVDEIVDFLLDLADKSQSFAEKEVLALHEFAEKELNIKPMNPWDISYVSEKYRIAKYALDNEKLREYFPVDKVLNGLFDITGQLFDISFKEQTDFNHYHDDVRLFHIQRNNETIAAFYFDLYARDKKRGGAWMADARSRWQHNDVQQLPVAFLTCNFRPASEGKPALLSHDEVTTLFHEFGHGLHHMLTSVNIAGVSGIAGVEWDAVELPSQFLENWCWQPEGLNKITEHYETKEALPQDLLNNMLAAKHFNAGMMMLRQVEFSLFDILLHTLTTINHCDQIQDLLDQVRDKVAIVEPPLEVRFQHGFSHVFAGGYAAGYFSYKWAEVLSADCFAAFEEEGIMNTETGQRFLTEILQRGSSRPAAQSFEAFRGRKPSVDALLKHSGLI